VSLYEEQESSGVAGFGGRIAFNSSTPLARDSTAAADGADGRVPKQMSMTCFPVRKPYNSRTDVEQKLRERACKVLPLVSHMRSESHFRVRGDARAQNEEKSWLLAITRERLKPWRFSSVEGV
jgi:hypothetical protein